MVNKYTVKDTKTFEEEAFMRVSTLTVSSKKQSSISKSLDRRFLDKKVFNSVMSSSGAINEIYLNMDLNQLRTMSNDDILFDRYMATNSSFLNTQAMNVFFVNLRVGSEDKISDEDIKDLNHILTWGINDIYLMPTVEYDGIDRKDELKLYEEFCKRMIDCKDTFVPGNLNLGINVPSFYRYKDLDNLFKVYSKENTQPTFVSVDFARTGFNDSKRKGIVGSINSYYKDKKIEDYFLYGFNVRNYKKKTLNPVSDEMMIARSGFNTMGAPHYGQSKRIIPPTTQLTQLGVVFNRDDYCFHQLTDNYQLARFVEWSSDFEYEFDITGDLPKEAPRIRPVMKKYNLCMENEEFSDISQAIRKSDSDHLRDKLKRGD